MTNLMKFIPFILFMSAILSMAGCETFQAASSPKQLWESPARDKNLKKTDPVWATIREQKIDNSKPLTLAELVDLALSNNPSTKQAWLSARSAQTQKKQAESTLYPQISVAPSITKERIVASQSKYAENFLGYGPSANLTYLILDFGGRSAAIEAASEAILSANFQFNQTFQDLLLAVEKSYYELYSSYATLEAAESDVENAKEGYDAARQRFEVGLASKLDVLQTKSNYENYLYNLEDAKGQVKTAKANLANTIGFPADTEFEIVSPSKDIPTDITDQNISELIKEAIEKRPDLASLQASLRSQIAAAKAAKSNLWPTLDATGGGQALWHKFPGSQNSNEHEYGYTAAVTLNWDIFDGFNNYNKWQQALIQADIQRSQLMQAELQASADVWIKYYAFNTAVKKLSFSRAFLETATSSYDLALQSYKAGLKSSLDLLDAESKLSDAKSNLIESRKELFIALVELAHATGSIGTESDSSASVTRINGEINK